jgi:hypothetical protein
MSEAQVYPESSGWTAIRGSSRIQFYTVAWYRGCWRIQLGGGYGLHRYWGPYESSDHRRPAAYHGHFADLEAVDEEIRAYEARTRHAVQGVVPDSTRDRDPAAAARYLADPDQ